ncbi:Poly(A) polymerase central domain-containing protein [Cokeromyces recurvatus]|uniref:Poly(A) polymerase central domain-containing protein n=1 Tax=Cokeromyces recurvatus TaxID=90255 RepID=UPI002220111F|nr:Poly(A) polymerase central domain-containing protein [Cokeromyces recurvatus]KAI7899221.1 Poly(A) polymerase central domain-containing protein [Cokeromyces recurvatus]
MNQGQQQQPQTQPQNYGITPPISTDPPTEQQLKLTDELIQTLRDYGLFESEQEAQKRVVVLGKLDKIVKEFVYKVSKLKGFPDSLAREAGGKIFTYGSYRLGVHGAGADIDTLCVFPKHVEREHFFTIMYDMLKARSEVTEIAAVPDAYVPVIKMHFSGIPIDFICARLAIARVPDDLELADNNILKSLDERCVRSLNGSRVTDDILRLVPNVNTFRIALRTIKLWAKSRCIYSNVMGFLGGVAWAMLIARICQLYPNACAAYIVNRFFFIMSRWRWPQPVLLRHLEDGPLQVRVWNPKLYPADRSHRMPIITPAYPSMCATHNVTDSTRHIMMNEFKLGVEITNKIFEGQAKWKDLFTKSNFFNAYKHYLQITSSSESAESQLTWSGLVEAKLRQLVLKMELVDMITLAHPYVKGVDKIHYCLTADEIADVIKGGTIQSRSFTVEEGSLETDHTNLLKEQGIITNENENDVKRLFTTTFYIGFETAPKIAGESRKLNLVWPVQEFTKLVKSWDKYDENQMKITIQSIKGSKLPVELTGEKKSKRSLDETETSVKKPRIESNGINSKKELLTPSAAATLIQQQDVLAPPSSKSSTATEISITNPTPNIPTMTDASNVADKTATTDETNTNNDTNATNTIAVE